MAEQQQQTIPAELSQDEALKVLVGALNVAQKKGKLNSSRYFVFFVLIFYFSPTHFLNRAYIVRQF